MATRLQCSCLENSMGRGACWTTVHGIGKSQHFEERMNNWRYNLDQMYMLSYISASLEFSSCFPM